MNRGMESTRHRSPLWSGLDHDTVRAILADAENRWARSGQVLQTAGQPGTHLFLVRKGRARYYHTTASGDEILLRILAPGDVFGLVALLNRPMQYMVNVDAISDCNVLSWGHRKIRSFVSSHPQLSENALYISLEYLKAYVDRHTRVIRGASKERLAATLIDLAQRIGRVRSHGVEVDATNEQLASLSDITRFTASRLLSAWQRKSAISKARGKIIIHAPEALTRV